MLWCPQNSQVKMDVIYRQVYKSFSNIPQVEIHRMKSEEAAGLFPNQYFDFIYIDGNHNYEFVKTDLINFSPKLKINGYICGDDYIFTRCGNGGPKRAVMEFTAEKIDFEQILPIQNNQFIIKRTIPM